MGAGGTSLVFIAGFLCGLITTVASSGAAVSLPLLLAVGLDPIMANATNRLPIMAASLTAVIRYHLSIGVQSGPPVGAQKGPLGVALID